MLTRLSLQNFKSWRTTGDVRLAPITGFFGTNSSGKTSLLQSLLLLKQTADSSDRGQVLHFGDSNSLADLGDFRAVVHKHSDGARLSLAVDWKAPAPLVILDSSHADQTVVESDDLGFSVEIGAQPAGTGSSAGKALRLQVQRFRYRVDAATFGMELRNDRKPEYELSVKDAALQFLRSRGRPWPLPPPGKCYGFPDEARAYYQNAGFVADLELAFEQRLRKIYYLGPLRAYPARQYPWSGAQPEDMGRAGEQAINAILASRERGITISRGKGKKKATLEEYVALWLKELGLIHSFRVEAISEGSQLFRVLVQKSPKSAEVLITDVGFGVSQILPVLVLCFYVPEGSTVILEQPEIHLHPAVQAQLADALIDAWRKRRVQILVESHSEHFLRRIQRRVAEESLATEDVGLYFCSTDQGESSLQPLQMDLLGSISNWPEDFFGDQLGEVAAAQTARLRRMVRR